MVKLLLEVDGGAANSNSILLQLAFPVNLIPAMPWWSKRHYRVSGLVQGSI